MKYPYDDPSFTPFTKAFLEVLRQYPALAEPIQEFLAPVEGLDGAGKAILHTLAHHSRPRIDLAWRSFFYCGDDSEGLDEEIIRNWEDYNVTEEAPNIFDAASGLLLGSSAGGEVSFGVRWDGGKLRFFEVDVEDELGEPIKVFDTADAFWMHVFHGEHGYAETEGEQAPAFLKKLWEAAGLELKWPS